MEKTEKTQVTNFNALYDWLTRMMRFPRHDTMQAQTSFVSGTRKPPVAN